MNFSCVVGEGNMAFADGSMPFCATFTLIGFASSARILSANTVASSDMQVLCSCSFSGAILENAASRLGERVPQNGTSSVTHKDYSFVKYDLISKLPSCAA